MRAAAVLIVDGITQPWNSAETADAPSLRVIEAEFRTNPLSARRFVLSDFLGATVLQRVINRLQICEVDPICILGDPHHPASVEFAHSPVDGPQPSFQNLWAEAEQLFLQFAQREIDFVFLIRLGTYAELDFVDLVCVNVYLENQQSFGAYIARLQNIAGNRPLVLAEIGLDSLRNGHEKQSYFLD